MTLRLESNIWKYALILTTNKRVFVAIIGSYYLTIPEVTPWWVGIFILAGSLASFIFEIPSGYIADKIGHKNGLILSKILLVLSSTFFLFAESIFPALMGAIFWSVGFAFHSGTGSALIFETIKELGREKEYTKIMGKISSIGFAIPVVFMVSVPFLVSMSFALPFLVSLIIDLIGLFGAVTLIKPTKTKKQIEEIGITNFREVLRKGYTLKFFRYAFFFGVLLGFSMSISGFRAPYQELLEIPVIYFGVLFGVGRILASLMLAYSGKLQKIFPNIKSLALFKMIFFSCLIATLGMTHLWWAVALIFIVLNAVQWGLIQVQNGHILHIIRDNSFKATLLSVQGQIASLFAAFGALCLGFMVEQFSYQAAFLLLALLLITFLVPPYILILKDPRSAKKAV